MSDKSETKGSSTNDVNTESMPLVAHLQELRFCLIKSVAAVGLCFIPCWSFSEKLFSFLSSPLINALPKGSSLSMLTAQEGFVTNLETSILAAVFFAFPVIAYQAWKFIAPGLHIHEKKLILPFCASATVFFIGGASFAYFAVFPAVFKFFMGYAADGGYIAANISMQSYLAFAAKLLLAFGLVFELPVAIFFLARLGLTTHRPLASARPYAIVIIFIIAAFLTPPDVVSQVMMAVPLYILYEISIIVARLAAPSEQPSE